MLPLLPQHDCPSATGLYKGRNRSIATLLWISKSFSFLSSREAALKRPGYLPDVFWHGLQTATCRGALSLHMAMLKTVKGENIKGNIQLVSCNLMRRSHGFCQSLWEQLTEQKIQQCLSKSWEYLHYQVNKRAGKDYYSLYKSIKNEAESFWGFLKHKFLNRDFLGLSTLSTAANQGSRTKIPSLWEGLMGYNARKLCFVENSSSSYIYGH